MSFSKSLLGEWLLKSMMMPDLESILEACVWRMAWRRLRLGLQRARHDNYALNTGSIKGGRSSQILWWITPFKGNVNTIPSCCQRGSQTTANNTCSKEGLYPAFLVKCLMKSCSKLFCGCVDSEVGKKQEQKPMCSVFTGFNCFGFELSS